MLVHQILSGVEQSWPPFVLVAGLLLIGAVAQEDGLFEGVGGQIARAPLRPRMLLVALLGLVAVVTAVLNLDTAVVFLTPVLVHAARRRAVDERPFLYGSIFMANSASLLLPGSNLTNLLVDRRQPSAGLTFALGMLPAWIASVGLTAVFVALAFRVDEGRIEQGEPPTLRLGLGAFAALAAALLVMTLANPAVPVLVVGLFGCAVRRLRPRVDVRGIALLFVLTVAIAAAARIWTSPVETLASGPAWMTAATAAVASLLLNNLPAAVLCSAHGVPHPRALLIGLDLGPNLAVTGSLAALLWFRAARAVGARPSVATYSRLGALLAPVTIAGALVALRLGPV